MFALDLGEKNLKIVRFSSEKRSKLRPVDYWIKEIPAGLFGEKAVKDREGVKKLLNIPLGKSGLNSISLRVSLPRSRGRLMVFDFPLLGKKELKEAVKWEMTRYLPFRGEEALFDFVCLEKGNKKQKIVAGAICAEFFRSFFNFLNELGTFKYERITLAPAALFPLCSNGKADHVVLDWGWGGATLVFMSRGVPLLIRNLSIQEENEFNEMEKNNSEGYFIRVKKEIERALLHLPQKSSSWEMEKMIITGGKALKNGFIEFLEKNFKVPVRFPEYFWPENQKEQVLLSAALGLANLKRRKTWKELILPDI